MSGETQCGVPHTGAVFPIPRIQVRTQRRKIHSYCYGRAIDDLDGGMQSCRQTKWRAMGRT